MSTQIGLLTEALTAREYYLPDCQLEALSIPSVAEVKTLVSGRRVVVGVASWDTKRLLGNAQWTLRFPGVTDREMAAIPTPVLKGLVLSWVANGTVMTLSGLDIMGIVDEPMLDIGDTAAQVYRTAQPWWGSGEVIKVDGVTQEAADYTVDAEQGIVTFDEPLTTPLSVTCTVLREPQVRFLSAQVVPLMGYDPIVYGVEAVCFELTP